jgi:ribosomal protein L37AE/L43A
MVSRQCPLCGYTWYSADDYGTWICSHCGAEIPPPEEKA